MYTNCERSAATGWSCRSMCASTGRAVRLFDGTTRDGLQLVTEHINHRSHGMSAARSGRLVGRARGPWLRTKVQGACRRQRVVERVVSECDQGTRELNVMAALVVEPTSNDHDLLCRCLPGSRSASQPPALSVSRTSCLRRAEEGTHARSARKLNACRNRFE
jgi:hypothetical protein